MSTQDQGAEETNVISLVDPEVVLSSFCQQTAPKSLRVTCYGSSSSKTPERYLKEARSLGYILAKRGHVCVNGAGSFGCMAAMNDGVLAGNGHVCGVIHEMFLVDNGYWGVDGVVIRDGGAHRVFQNAKTSTKKKNNSHVSKEEKQQQQEETHEDESDNENGPIREILVAGGNDLQERKKLLVRNCDALIVLPGGPGTWDELWEMACARHLNLNRLPIVCVNVDGYYEPFREVLDKAHEDELIKLPPHEIVHFADTAEEAIRWVEGEKEHGSSKSRKSARFSSKKSVLKQTSFFSASPYQDLRSSFYSMMSSVVDDEEQDNNAEGQPRPLKPHLLYSVGLAFLLGTTFGAVVTSSLARRR